MQRVGGRHHAGDALGAAGAGEQADLDLRQPEPGLVVVRGDALVAGEAELKAAAKRGAVDGGDERLAAGLDPPVELRQLAAFGEQHRGRSFLALAFGELAERARQRFQQGQVGAGAERVLARGDDRALDRGIAGDFLHDRGQFLDRREIDHVHRASGHIPGDERDAVGIDIELEIVGHRSLPRQRRSYSLIGFAGLAHPAAALVVALHAEIDIGIMHALVLGAGADLEIERVLVGAVDQAMADAAVGAPAGSVARLEHGLAGVLVQHELAFEHVDELVLALVPVAERGFGMRLDARDIDAELRQPHRIAEPLLLAAGDDVREFLRIGAVVVERDFGAVDLRHGDHAFRGGYGSPVFFR